MVAFGKPVEAPQDWPLIYAYTRRQAIEDGWLVDLMQEETAPLVRRLGFRIPVAMTRAALVETVAPIEADLPEGESLKARLVAVLAATQGAIRMLAGGADRVIFRLLVRDYETGKPKRVALKAVCGPGDEGEPVLTIMLPEED